MTRAGRSSTGPPVLASGPPVLCLSAGSAAAEQALPGLLGLLSVSHKGGLKSALVADFLSPK